MKLSACNAFGRRMEISRSCQKPHCQKPPGHLALPHGESTDFLGSYRIAFMRHGRRPADPRNGSSPQAYRFSEALASRLIRSRGSYRCKNACKVSVLIAEITCVEWIVRKTDFTYTLQQTDQLKSRSLRLPSSPCNVLERSSNDQDHASSHAQLPNFMPNVMGSA